MNRCLMTLICVVLFAAPALGADNTCKPGDMAPGCKPDLSPHAGPEVPGVSPGRPSADRPGHDAPHSNGPLDRIHSEGHGWGAISTGMSVEPAGYYKDKTIGVGITVHFLELPQPSRTRYTSRRP
jgi:hypothetical protein